MDNEELEQDKAKDEALEKALEQETENETPSEDETFAKAQLRVRDHKDHKKHHLAKGYT